MLSKYLVCGKIVNTHGIAGEVRVENYCDTPEVLSSFKNVYFKKGEIYTKKKVNRSFVSKNAVVMKLEGVDNIDLAQSLRGTELYAAREDIPIEEGAYFIADLIGLEVIDAENGRVYGKIVDVINRGASDIYVINTKNGEVMFPAVPEFVDRTDIERAVYINPIEGMFEDEI